MATQNAAPPPGAAGTVQLNLRIDPALKERFRADCQTAGRRVQEVIAELMGEWVARQGDQQGPDRQ